MDKIEVKKAVLEVMEFLEEEGYKFPNSSIRGGYISPLEAGLEVLEETYPQLMDVVSIEEVANIMENLNELWSNDLAIESYLNSFD